MDNALHQAWVRYREEEFSGDATQTRDRTPMDRVPMAYSIGAETNSA
jgi:hypothetical protein